MSDQEKLLTDLIESFVNFQKVTIEESQVKQKEINLLKDELFSLKAMVQVLSEEVTALNQKGD